MDAEAQLKNVEESELYRTFKREEPDAYLAHLFSMHPPGQAPECQIGYFLPAKEKLVVFKATPLERLPPDAAFNKGARVKKLVLDDVKLTVAEAEERALGILKKEFPAEEATQVILILQHLDRTIYNCTLVTRTFNILNIKLDAASGDLLQQEMRSIMSLRRE